MVFVLFVENIKEENKINEKETNEQTKPYMVTRYKTSNDKLTLKQSPRKRLQTYFQIPPASDAVTALSGFTCAACSSQGALLRGRQHAALLQVPGEAWILSHSF